MTLKTQWVRHALSLAGTPADLYSGCRKILQSRTISFRSLDDSLRMSDAGYTKSKMTMLTKHYLHEESRAVAIELWNKRREQAKYGSVGFTTYNHFVKGGSIDAKRSKRASVFGPCIQSVIITWVDKKTVNIDIPYRTTEFFKKFAADLVFLHDVLLDGFDFTGMKVGQINFRFANITLHPMYFVTLIPHLENPIENLDILRKSDKHFWTWTTKWTARYVCDEHMRGIQKFAQAMRVKMDATARIDKHKLRKLQKYLRNNHPGHRNKYEEPEEDD